MPLSPLPRGVGGVTPVVPSNGGVPMGERINPGGPGVAPGAPTAPPGGFPAVGPVGPISGGPASGDMGGTNPGGPPMHSGGPAFIGRGMRHMGEGRPD